MLVAYTWILRLLFPYLCLRLLFRGLRNRAYWRRVPERFGFVPPLPTERVIWVHAVSVGEAQAAAPLVHALQDRYPGHRIVFTTTTPTGSAQAQKLFAERVAHYYAPYDYPSAVRRFLERTRPELALFMEKEFWPNMFHLCRERSIPIAIVNACVTETSLRGYRRFVRLIRSTLQQANLIAAQSEANARRLLALGALSTTVHVTGSIKFELSLPASLIETAQHLRRQWGAGRPVWIAASTHEGEEEQVLRAHAELRRLSRYADLLLVLVPRHPERFGAVARLCRKAGFSVALRSESRGPLDRSVGVLLGDTMGELQVFYGAGDVAFVGGSLLPGIGGHNLLEAAAMGKPVTFGPYMHNIEEISRIAVERGAGVQVADGAQLAAAVDDFLANADRRYAAGEAGRRMVEENRGALERTVALIDRLIPK